jgi:spore coat protein CotH
MPAIMPGLQNLTKKILISYEVSMKIKFWIIGLSVFILHVPGFGQNLVINEFMADNAATILDSTDTKYEDWIELYNAGTESVNLSGFGLTDNPDLPMQWPLPDLTLNAGEFLLIWSDGDAGDPGLHANFKLSKDGEFLGLFYTSATDTTVVDSLSFGSQLTDISRGRFPDGTSVWQSFTVPTPGKTNNPTVVDVDSSYILFDNSIVHQYHLHFYVENWEDTLKYNYENGELYMPAQLTYNGLVVDSIGVRYKGNSSYQLSRNTPKKPFKFKFTKFIKRNVLYNTKELNFSNCVNDPSFMREKISYDILRQYLPAPRTAYANIYVDGALIGLYVQVEEVDKVFLARHFNNIDGNLYKASDNGTKLQYLGTDPSAYTAGLELKTNEDENDWSGLIEFLDLLNNTPAEAFIATVSPQMNLEWTACLLASNMVMSNFDSYLGSGRNFYLYDDPESGQFHLLPWDLNESFGAYANNWNVITANIVNIPNLSERPLTRRILENAGLKAIYLKYIEKMLSGPAAFDSVLAKTQIIQPFIESYVQADANKLYSYDKFVTNIGTNVTVDLGRIIPGILSFSHQRNANLAQQLANISDVATGTAPAVVRSYSLSKNYPNPFNPSTVIGYELKDACVADLSVYDATGRLVSTVVHQTQPAGQHSVTFNAAGLASGIYFYRLKTSTGFTTCQKMLLIK